MTPVKLNKQYKSCINTKLSQGSSCVCFAWLSSRFENMALCILYMTQLHIIVYYTQIRWINCIKETNIHSSVY